MISDVSHGLVCTVLVVMHQSSIRILQSGVCLGAAIDWEAKPAVPGRAAAIPGRLAAACVCGGGLRRGLVALVPERGYVRQMQLALCGPQKS